MKQITNKKNIFLFIFLAIFSIVLLSSCGCAGDQLPTYEESANSLEVVQISHISNQISSSVKPISTLDEETKYNVQSNINTKLTELKTSLSSLAYDKWLESINTCIASILAIENIEITSSPNAESILGITLTGIKSNAQAELNNFLNKLKESTEIETHSEKLILNSIGAFSDKIEEATTADPNIQIYTVYTKEDLNNATDVYQILQYFILQTAIYRTQPEPIHFYGFSEGFWGHLFNNLLVFPVAWLIITISKLFGGLYVVGLLITTLLIRTLGWPIYARSNDMQLKMKLMQPEIDKLKEKYATRKDPDSQRMMQYEQMKLYKKYKVGIGGCLMPLLQFPIFLSMFRAISRIPYTNAENSAACGIKDLVSDLNTKIFGIDLFETRGATGSWQFWGIIILIVLVVGTQLLSQWYMQRNQKVAQQKTQENIPLYRRQAASQQSSAAGTMKFMLYFMTFMMGAFVFSSAAGLGLYWLIGNLYSLLQSLLNTKLSAKRMEQLREKHNSY